MSELLTTDVLAVLDMDDYIFVGIGYTLRTYKKSTNEIVGELDVCYPDKIHGFVKGPGNLLAIFGGQNLSIVDVAISDEKIETTLLGDVHRFKDWIIAVGWSSHTDNATTSILFAHNTLWNYNCLSLEAEQFTCEEKCILYGGSIVSKHTTNVTVLAGTVFQEIVIWNTAGHKDNEKLPVLHRLRGHNGVIFSVTFDPVTSMICSTSDDRTIRLWFVKFESLPHGSCDWTRASISLVSTMFGHTARAWRALIRKDFVVSIGEDSLLCIWTIKGSLIDKIEAHHGAPIWCLDINEKCDTIVTGGGDGAVFAWPLRENVNHTTNCISMNDIPKHIGFLDKGNLVVITQTGKIVCYDQDTNSVKQSIDTANYGNYVVVQLSPNRRCIGLASINGYISIYRDNEKTSCLENILEQKVMNSKILSMHWLSNESLLACGMKGRLKMLEINNDILTVKSKYVLPPSREQWTTAAAVTKMLLICGDRAGSIHVFKIHGERTNMTEHISDISSEIHPFQSFLKIHGRLGVHSCTIIKDQLLTTGRDGTVRFYQRCEIEDDESISTLNVDRMPMDWVSTTLKTGTDLYVLGFKEVNFILYSTLHQRILLRILCGGGHRSWDYNLNDGILDFAYIRDKQIQLVKCQIHSLVHPVIQDGFHTKAVCCMQRVQTCTGQNILISGGEDRHIRITHVRNSGKRIRNGRDFKMLALLSGHISSIKSLFILNLKDTMTCCKNLLFSGGGRAQLKVWLVNITFMDGGSLIDGDLSCKELASHMLRGTDQQQKWTLQREMQQPHYVDPETRYMDISISRISADPDVVVLLMACSDGFLRIFVYNIRTSALNLHNSMKYDNRCILKGHLFTWNENMIALSMATDGIVNFWNLNKTVEHIINKLPGEETTSQCILLFARLNLHQCGINSYDLKVLGTSEFILATGGDDNLLCLVVFTINSNNGRLSLQETTKWVCSSTHSTQITGLILQGKSILHSIGIDQKVVTFNYRYDSGKLIVSHTSQMMTSITDVQGMTSCLSHWNDSALLCIYGQGFELVRRILEAEHQLE